MLEFRTCLPTPGVGFLFNPPPPPGIQPQPSNAAEMEAPLWRVTSWRVDTSACATTRSKTDPLCRKGTGPVWRRCANSTFGVLARPRLGNPGVVPRKNGGCEHAHRLKTVYNEYVCLTASSNMRMFSREELTSMPKMARTAFCLPSRPPAKGCPARLRACVGVVKPCT